MFAFKVARLRLGVPMAKASWLADLLVFRKVRAALGGRLKLCISGAAPLSTQVRRGGGAVVPRRCRQSPARRLA